MEFAVGNTPVTITRTTVLLFVLGAVCVGYGGYEYETQSAAVEDAVAVDGTVVETRIDQSSASRGVSYAATVEYTYQYQGTEYTNDDLYPGTTTRRYDSRAEAERVVDSYDPNETVTVYVVPATPAEAFLERQTTATPFQFAGLGILVVVFVSLDAVGARNPGRGTTLRPVGEHESLPYETLFGLDRETVNRLSKRLVVTATVGIVLSLLATVGLLLAADSSSHQVDPTDPLGLTLLSAFVASLAVLAGTALYGLWSVTEYRRLRERMPEPRPPSPFRHPTRLVSILLTNDGLDAYGRRVKLTGFTLVVAVFFVGVLAEILLL